MQCYRHPKVETGVSCGRCERPICIKCMVSGPAGMRCRDCASLRTTALYQIPPWRLALATAAGLVTGIVGAYLITMIGFFGFFVFFVGPIYGGIVAEAVLRSAGRKRGLALEIIAVGSIVIGAVLSIAPTLLHSHSLVAIVRYAWPLVGIGLAISTCYGRLKYL